MQNVLLFKKIRLLTIMLTFLSSEERLIIIQLLPEYEIQKEY